MSRKGRLTKIKEQEEYSDDEEVSEEEKVRDLEDKDAEEDEELKHQLLKLKGQQTLVEKAKADCKAEIHCIGSIVGGAGFNTDDGLFCEMVIQQGKYWKLLSPPNKYQTHTAIAKVRNYRYQEHFYNWA